MTKKRSTDEELVAVRIDKWLWAARCFKTRTLAQAACEGGHAKVNGKVAKPSQKVKTGDQIQVLTMGGKKILLVKGLAEKRGPYSVACTLYEDQSPPVEKEIAPPRFERGKGRPTKKSRRELRKLRGW